MYKRGDIVQLVQGVDSYLPKDYIIGNTYVVLRMNSVNKDLVVISTHVDSRVGRSFPLVCVIPYFDKENYDID